LSRLRLIRLSWRGLPEKKALAYLTSSSVTKREVFILYNIATTSLLVVAALCAAEQDLKVSGSLHETRDLENSPTGTQ
jgi:hypothetical protein